MIDYRIIQYKSASEACSKKTFLMWENERLMKIKKLEEKKSKWKIECFVLIAVDGF